MAIYHCTTKPVARKSGRSAVAAASYRFGQRLNDERLGMVHDYTRRGGIEDREIPIVLPSSANGSWTRERLWNAAEESEKRCDARTAREWEIAFPSELSAAGRKATAVAFARALANRYGCAVDVALHLPSARGDQRNYHAHLLTTTRKIEGAALGEKTSLELSNSKRDELGLGTTQSEIEGVRATWSEVVNAQLEQDGHAARIDHRTLAAQEQAALQRGDEQAAAELRRIPLPRLTRNVMQIERRGFNTQAGDRRREAVQSNAARTELLKQMKATTVEITALEEEFDAKEKEALARQQHHLVEHVERLQRQSLISKEHIEERARQLWQRSPIGQAEYKAAKQYEDDQWWSVKYRRDIDDAKADLSAWKKEHPFQSLVVENVSIMNRLHEVMKRHASHQDHVRSAYAKTLHFAEKKAEAWPALLKQAAEDFKQVAVKLLPAEVLRLLADAFGQDHDRIRRTLRQLQTGPQSGKFIDTNVQLAKGEDSGVVAVIRQLDEPLLRKRLIRLEERESRTQRRQNHLDPDNAQRRRELDRDKGIGD